MNRLKEIFTVSKYSFLQPDGGFGAKLFAVVKTYGLVILTLIAVGPLLVLADKLVTDVLHHKSINENNTRQFRHFFKYWGRPGAIVFICVIGPLMEELIFRLWLNFKKRDIALSAVIGVIYFGMAMCRYVVPAKHAWMIVPVALILMSMLALMCRYLVSNAGVPLTERSKYRLILFSMVIFALMHVSNYKPLEARLFWVYPLFVIPQLLMGWGVTYIRFKNGFTWGVVLHMLINTVSTLAALWMKRF